LNSKIKPGQKTLKQLAKEEIKIIIKQINKNLEAKGIFRSKNDDRKLRSLRIKLTKWVNVFNYGVWSK
jgi:hypothetical protein